MRGTSKQVVKLSRCDILSLIFVTLVHQRRRQDHYGIPKHRHDNPEVSELLISLAGAPIGCCSTTWFIRKVEVLKWHANGMQVRYVVLPVATLERSIEMEYAHFTTVLSARAINVDGCTSSYHPAHRNFGIPSELKLPATCWSIRSTIFSFTSLGDPTFSLFDSIYV